MHLKIRQIDWATKQKQIVLCEIIFYIRFIGGEVKFETCNCFIIVF